MSETVRFGPIQLFVVGFDNVEKFTGEIIRELRELRGRDIIRIVDALFVAKALDGSLAQITTTDLSHDEAVAFGNSIGKLMGMDVDGSVDSAFEAVTIAEDSFGLGKEDIQRLKDNIKPGTSALVLLVEHIWATRLSMAVRRAGGQLVGQGIMTPKALMMVGKELNAIAEAEMTLELADAVKGAAILDAIGTVAEARYIEATALFEAEQVVKLAMSVKAAAVADALRALVVAGLIEEAAVQEAVDVLTEAELIEETAVKEAVKTAEANRQEIADIKAEVDAAAVV